MTEAWTFILGLTAGIGGYLVTTFWMEPILLYRQIRHQVISDLIFYGNAINFDHGSPEIRQRALERGIANRRHAAELVACYWRLPRLYKWYLQRRGQDPSAAASDLIGFSNTPDLERAEPRLRQIEQFLGIPRVL